MCVGGAGGVLAFVSRALTSVNLIKSMCVCVCVRMRDSVCFCASLCAPLSRCLQAQRGSVDALPFIRWPKVG